MAIRFFQCIQKKGVTSLTRDEFLKAIEKNEIPGLLLFEGEEENLKHEALKLLRQKMLPEGLEQLNETILTAPAADDVITAAETLPFLADKRLVIIRDQDGFYGKKEPDEKLLTYWQKGTPSTCILIFYCEGKPDKRRKIYTSIKAKGTIVTFVQLKNQALTSWITDQFRRNGKKCSARNADYLSFTCGSDTELLKGEISKLSAFSPEREEINADDIRVLATRSSECSVFQLVDAVTSAQDSRAIQLMQTLLRVGEEPLSILGMLIRNYRILRSLMIMKMEKKDSGYICSALGINPFALEQYNRQTSLISGKQVKTALEACISVDYGIKSGRIGIDGALEALILKLLDLMHKKN